MKKLLRNLGKWQRGFTLIELMVVVAILSVLMAVVAPAVTGTKSISLEGQVKSDAAAAQTSTDNFGNKSIKVGQWPEAKANLSTGLLASHAYTDVWAVITQTGGFGGAAVNLLGKDGVTSLGTLATKITDPQSGTAYFQRNPVDFTKTTDTYDSGGKVKQGTFVPDFLLKAPSSLILKGDETKVLGDTNNTYDEFLWLLKVNAPGTDTESRTVEVFRMVDPATTSGTLATSLTYQQIH